MEKADFFETYNKAFKSWPDTFGSWRKTMASFCAISPDNDKSGFVQIMEKLPLPYKRMRDTNETIIKGMNSYREIHGSCIRTLADMAREGYKIEMSLLTGEKAETDRLFEIFESACDDIAVILEETFEDTPFEGMDEAIKDSRDALSDERLPVKALFREITAFNGKMLKISTSAIREGMNVFSDVREKGTISVEPYKNMASLYGETLSQSLDILSIPEPVLADCKSSVDSSALLAGKNLDALAVWLEMNLKSTRAVGKSADEIFQFARGILRNGNASSQKKFYKEWSQTCEKAACNLIEGVHFNGSIPKFINICTDCMESANDHWRIPCSLCRY